MINSQVSIIFRDIAKILEIKGDNRFRIRAYERAAQNIEGMTEDIKDYAKDNRLQEIAGIGKDLEDKITEIVNTGKLKYYTQLKKTIPSGLLDLLNIPSVGPRTIKLLYDELRIKSVAELERAIKKNKLNAIFGIKEKTVENISKGIELLKRDRERIPLHAAMQMAEDFVKRLRSLKEAEKVSVAGSLRRKKESVRDIDILVVSKEPKKVMDAFVAMPFVKEVVAEGLTKTSVRTKADVGLDCRVVAKQAYGAAMVYFTGSKNFNIKIRQLAIKNGLKINEYGVFKKDRFIAGASEEDIFKALHMEYVEPEMREDTGEIELALESRLPHLIELADIKGDLHVHSNWSDGLNSIDEMAQKAQNKGYEYVAIADHSQSLKIAGGLSINSLNKKKKEIDKLNSKLKNLRVLFATEVDIDSTGHIDYPDDVLKNFDIVVAAIHSGFKQSRSLITKRLVGACRNKYVNVIAHPTGRLWGARDSYDIDWNLFLRAARDTNTALEINSFPQRLDLNDHYCRQAKETGVKLAINTDSHSIEHLDLMSFGVSVARRGWLVKENVINTLPLDKLLKEMKK